MFNPSTTSRSRAWAEVRLDRLRANAQAIRRAVGPDVGLVPMVKADAYGLGMAAVVAALREFPSQHHPWAFGVAAVAEGERLRAAGWSGRILVFSPALPQEYSRAAAAELTLCLSDTDAVARWADEARRCNRLLPFHLEIDTGMGRAGLPWRDAAEWGPQVRAEAGKAIRWEGTYTHFHSADEGDLRPTAVQLERFQQAIAALPEIEPRPLIHTGNSAAAFRVPQGGCDLARPGIYLYGGNAGPNVEPKAVASVRARVSLVRTVEPGATVGYGATYRANQSETWGTLAIGYGDGIPRALATGGGEAIVHGVRVPIIGRISMDMTTVDLSGVPRVRPGDVATLIGEADGASIQVDEVAERCGTISYEILTGLTSRLPRVYLDGEQEIDPVDYYRAAGADDAAGRTSRNS